MKSDAFLLPKLQASGVFGFGDAAFLGTGVRIMSDYLQQLTADYEQDILGNVYTFYLSNGETLSFEIKKKNVPHLLGIGKMPLRQVHGKYASELYMAQTRTNNDAPYSECERS